MTEPDLNELATAAAAGDRASLETLLGALYEQLHLVCRRICGADADDATQQAMIAVARGIGRFDGRSAVTTWAYRVATNAALDELRKRKRHGAHDDVDDLQLASRDPERFAQVDDRLVIQAALEELAPDYRAVIVLREIAGLDYDDIAAALDIPIGTVRSRLSRGRRHLANALTGGNQIDSVDVEPLEP